MSELDQTPSIRERIIEATHQQAWVRAFEERYGDGAHARLLDLFANPRVSYADIASRFGVTRERVRQWHHELYPDAPRGHERRRTRSIYNRKRKLLEDPLFRAFVRAARGTFASGEIVPVTARDGFRKRLVKVAERTVLLRRASRARTMELTGGRRAYSLSGSRGDAEFIFFPLDGGDFLFVPRPIIPPGGTTYTDSDASPYRIFKNTFAALHIG
ncbi:MAG: hypothetical protein QM736_14065 [Vicinamibacterales bacterium]